MIRTGPIDSISSFIISVPRADMVAKKCSRSCSLVPFSATVRTLRSTRAEDFLQLNDIDHQQVFENEHQMANGFDQVRVMLLDHLEDFLAGAGIEAIEHLRDGANAAIGLAAEFADRFAASCR